MVAFDGISGVMMDFPMNYVHDWKNLSEREVHRIIGY